MLIANYWILWSIIKISWFFAFEFTNRWIKNSHNYSNLYSDKKQVMMRCMHIPQIPLSWISFVGNSFDLKLIYDNCSFFHIVIWLDYHTLWTRFPIYFQFQTRNLVNCTSCIQWHNKKSARFAGTFSLHASLASLSAPRARDSIVALRAPFFLDLALRARSFFSLSETGNSIY